MTSLQPFSPQDWQALQGRWMSIATRFVLGDRTRSFFSQALGPKGNLGHIQIAGGDIDYILFVFIRYWIPPVLPPPGRERNTKHDPDYWLESEQILKGAVERLRELKPLIDILTAQNPLDMQAATGIQMPPVVELELASMLEGIAEVAGSYGGPDYTSVIKNFDPIPLRQTQPFKHNKKNSAELWVVFLLREHFKALGLGKDRYWPMITGIITAAGIVNANGYQYSPDDLKSWWQKNWPRTYTQFDQPQAKASSSGEAYTQDFEWFHAWLIWQRTQPALSHE